MYIYIIYLHDKDGISVNLKVYSSEKLPEGEFDYVFLFIELRTGSITATTCKKINGYGMMMPFF